MSGPPTIAVVHASVGSGHRIAAESIAAQLSELSPGSRVVVLDVLEFGAYRVSGDTAAGAFTGPTAPLYDAVWGSPAIGRASMAVSGPFLSLLYSRYTRWLRDNRPSAIVTTHSLPATLSVRATRRGDLARVPVVAAATDFGLHGYWPRRGLTLFCVADDAERDELVRRGTSESAIAVTGIPVRPQFTVAADRAQARDRFDLGSDSRVVLALAGATVPGPYARFKESLATTLPAIASLPDVMVAVITGRDDAFAEELRSRVAGFGAKNVRVLGYVEEMAQVMSAADVVVCKPGGLVTAECVVAGLPMVLVGPAVGQERANVEALVGGGAAVFDDDPRRLAEIVRKTLARTGKLEQMRGVCARLARPDAAHDAAQRVLGLVGS
jgi:processive 1,2-diacylglycerol beta-glucosyltransferase